MDVFCVLPGMKFKFSGMGLSRSVFRSLLNVATFANDSWGYTLTYLDEVNRSYGGKLCIICAF